MLAGSKDGPTNIFFVRIGPGRPARPPSPAAARATGELVQAQGWVLTSLCGRSSWAFPRQWDRKRLLRCVLPTQVGNRPQDFIPTWMHPIGLHLERSDLAFPLVRGHLWAWLDLNQRPRPDPKILDEQVRGSVRAEPGIRSAWCW